MRITSGKFKSRIIKAPGGIRPTLDNVRKAIFDILGARIAGARVLDLYAGSGAMGFEAMSRGAASCIFVDNSASCVKAINTNLADLGLSSESWKSRLTVVRADAAAAMRKFQRSALKFDIIFIDPPYYKELAKKSLFLIGDYDILTNHAVVIVEHSKHDEVPSSAGGLILFRSARYGDTQISFYYKE